MEAAASGTSATVISSTAGAGPASSSCGWAASAASVAGIGEGTGSALGPDPSDSGCGSAAATTSDELGPPGPSWPASVSDSAGMSSPCPEGWLAASGDSSTIGGRTDSEVGPDPAASGCGSTGSTTSDELGPSVPCVGDRLNGRGLAVLRAPARRFG